MLRLKPSTLEKYFEGDATDTFIRWYRLCHSTSFNKKKPIFVELHIFLHVEDLQQTALDGRGSSSRKQVSLLDRVGG